jgi:hypothetical protein
MSSSKEYYTELEAQDTQQNTSDLSLITPDSDGKVQARNLYQFLGVNYHRLKSDGFLIHHRLLNKIKSYINSKGLDFGSSYRIYNLILT